MIERDACPFCGAPLGESRYKIAYDDPRMRSYLDAFYSAGEGVEHALLADAQYEILRCGTCQGFYQRFIPDDALMVRLYDHWIDPTATWARRSQHPASYYASNCAEVMQLAHVIGRPPGQIRVLDFGMGWGEWALAAKGMGFQVVGAELAQSRIDHAKANGIDVIDYDDIPGAGFDLINTEQVFEHLPRPLDFMRHLVSGLAPGGRLKINVPDAPNMEARLKTGDWTAPKGTPMSMNPLAPLEHINLFVPETGAHMARICGVTLQKIPIGVQLRTGTYWYGRSRILRNLAMPFYRNMLNRKNYFVFQAPAI